LTKRGSGSTTLFTALPQSVLYLALTRDIHNAIGNIENQVGGNILKNDLLIHSGSEEGADEELNET
jgi:hypothetical protein